MDLSNLQKGGSFTLKNVKLPKGVEAHIRGTQLNPTLLSIVPPAEEMVAPVEAAPAAPAKKGKK
ncbi:50S ribosomal protein L25 [compost metagenome]